MKSVRASQLNSEGCGKADITVDEITQVGDVVTSGDGAIQADTEGEPAVHVWIDAASRQYARVHHTAASPLDPAFTAAGSAGIYGVGFVVAHIAQQIHFGAWFGEREV